MSAVRHFVPEDQPTPTIPFEFVVNLPPPRYGRKIVQRDPIGRIVNSVTM